MAYKKKTWDSGDQVTHNDLNKWETALDEHDKEIVKIPDFEKDIQKQIDVLNTNIGDATTLKTNSKEVVSAINENTDEITALQAKVSQCMSNAGYGFISEDVLTNAGYPQPYVGSANNSTTMPNTGQWRVMYIPYVAPSEGYSVQVAYGCVNNDTIWYRKSHGLVWNEWKQVATTDKIDTQLTPLGSLKITGNNVCRVRSVGGANFLQLELQATDIVESYKNIVVLPPEVRPTTNTPFSIILGNTSLVGWIYSNGGVVLHGGLTNNQVIVANTPI